MVIVIKDQSQLWSEQIELDLTKVLCKHVSWVLSTFNKEELYDFIADTSGGTKRQMLIVIMDEGIQDE